MIRHTHSKQHTLTPTHKHTRVWIVSMSSQRPARPFDKPSDLRAVRMGCILCDICATKRNAIAHLVIARCVSFGMERIESIYEMTRWIPKIWIVFLCLVLITMQHIRIIVSSVYEKYKSCSVVLNNLWGCSIHRRCRHIRLECNDCVLHEWNSTRAHIATRPLLDLLMALSETCNTCSEQSDP